MQTRWYHHPIAIGVFLLFIYPLGLYLMWKHARWNQAVKVIVTVVMAPFGLALWPFSVVFSPLVAIGAMWHHRQLWPTASKVIATVVLSLGFVGIASAMGDATSTKMAPVKVAPLSATPTVVPQPTTVHKTETATSPVAFTEERVEDNQLPQGQTKTLNEGVNGELTSTFDVVYTDGKEVGRSKVNEAVTRAAVNRHVAFGSYAAPAPAPVPGPNDNGGGSGYTNSDGNHVNSPGSNPNGATAICGDGSYSYSQHRSGTCSHHGGVAQWL